MKVTVKQSNTKKYPWVGQLITKEHTTIVFFIGTNEGFCLNSTDQSNLEDRYSYAWIESQFTPVTVTLENED
jgi:hypothetical protein